MTMLVHVTAAYLAAVEQATETIVFDRYVLTPEFGYVPTDELQGIPFYEGTPADPAVEDGNRVKYSVFLASSVGPLTFGTVGLYRGNTLMAVGVSDQEIIKIPLNTETDKGGAFVIDFHLPMVTEAYAMWADVAMANTLKLASAAGLHLLPNARSTNPNLYTVNPRLEQERSFLAYCNRRGGPWEFDQYTPLMTTPVKAVGTTTSVVIDRSHAETVGGYRQLTGSDFIVQIMDGAAFSACRYVKAIMPGGNQSMVLSLDVPLTSAPTLPYRVAIYESNHSYREDLPFATPEVAGRIRTADVFAARNIEDPSAAVTPNSLGFALMERFRTESDPFFIIPGFTVPAVDATVAVAFNMPGDSDLAIGKTVDIAGAGLFEVTHIQPSVNAPTATLKNLGGALNSPPGRMVAAGAIAYVVDEEIAPVPTPLQQAVFQSVVTAMQSDPENARLIAEAIHEYIPDVFTP